MKTDELNNEEKDLLNKSWEGVPFGLPFDKKSLRAFISVCAMYALISRGEEYIPYVVDDAIEYADTLIKELDVE